MSGLLGDDNKSRLQTAPSGGGFEGSAPAPTTRTAASAAEEAANRILDAEQQRSERDRIAAIQRQLSQETAFRARGYGIRSLLGSLGSGRRSVLGAG